MTMWRVTMTDGLTVRVNLSARDVASLKRDAALVKERAMKMAEHYFGMKAVSAVEEV